MVIVMIIAVVVVMIVVMVVLGAAVGRIGMQAVGAIGVDRRTTSHDDGRAGAASPGEVIGSGTSNGDQHQQRDGSSNECTLHDWDLSQ